MGKISIHVEMYCDVSREPETDDEWDRGDTSWSQFIEGWTFSSKWHDDVPVIGRMPEKDETIWLVWATYSTGDSFGYDENSETELFYAFTDKKLAEEYLKMLQERDKNAKDYDRFEGTLSSGDKVSFHMPWHGFFEHLNLLECVEVPYGRKGSYAN